MCVTKHNIKPQEGSYKTEGAVELWDSYLWSICRILFNMWMADYIMIRDLTNSNKKEQCFEQEKNRITVCDTTSNTKFLIGNGAFGKRT